MTFEDRADQEWWHWYIGSDELHASFMHRKLQEVMPDARVEWFALRGVRPPSKSPNTDDAKRYSVLTKGAAEDSEWHAWDVNLTLSGATRRLNDLREAAPGLTALILETERLQPPPDGPAVAHAKAHGLPPYDTIRQKATQPTS
jgi:hypothetical protein